MAEGQRATVRLSYEVGALQPGTGLDIHRGAAALDLDHAHDLLALQFHDRKGIRATVTKVRRASAGP